MKGDSQLRAPIPFSLPEASHAVRHGSLPLSSLGRRTGFTPRPSPRPAAAELHIRAGRGHRQAQAAPPRASRRSAAAARCAGSSDLEPGRIRVATPVSGPHRRRIPVRSSQDRRPGRRWVSARHARILILAPTGGPMSHPADPARPGASGSVPGTHHELRRQGRVAWFRLRGRYSHAAPVTELTAQKGAR